MPEYLAPGVYVEETSFRSKSIEGVSTSTAGFVGPTRYGPISGEPELVTSLAAFERIYGGFDDLRFANEEPQINYMAHGVRAFFEEGGKRLYVMRVFNPGDSGFGFDADGIPANHYATTTTATTSPPAPDLTLVARFPGAAGEVRVTFTLTAGNNAFNPNPPGGGGPALARVRDYDLVHVRTQSGSPPTPTAVRGDGLFLARWDATAERWELRGNGATVLLTDAELNGAEIRPVRVSVEVESPTVSALGTPMFEAPELMGEFGFDPRSSNGLTRTFARTPPTRFQALHIPFAIEVPTGFAASDDELPLAIARELLGESVVGTLLDDTANAASRRISYTLDGGSDGERPDNETYAGDAANFNDYQNNPLDEQKNGLLTFEGLEDISILAAPGYSADYADNPDQVLAIQNALINHCEQMKYRIAVLDTPPNQLPSGALNYRNQRSSKYGALYYPWVTVFFDGMRLNLPPSGFVAGIYARNDVEHAVFKAPANEVVRSAIDFELKLNKAQQEILNPEGVNCFRFFEGRGYLLWGARTISDDPEWKYVNVRRYFIYLERSIDEGTQWVVFENNGPKLWDNVRRTVEDFLFNEWKQGAMLGSKPEESYFVRCDLSTMTQNDLDNGRLICLIGVAPVKPAEFVIFRIGQWTANSTQ